MSWSVSATGKAAPVAAEVEKQFALGHCMEPEETVRQAARALIAAALAAQTDPVSAVKVQAAGSQSQKYDKDGKATNLFTNNLSITVENLWGFIE